MHTIQTMCVQVDMNVITPTPPQMTHMHILLRVSTCVHGFYSWPTLETMQQKDGGDIKPID